MPVRICAVSFVDLRGIRHTVEVQAESLFEAAILGVRTLKGDPWIEHVGPATVLDIDVRDPAAKHAITMMQVERCLGGLDEPERRGQEGETEEPADFPLTLKFSRDPTSGNDLDRPISRVLIVGFGHSSDCRFTLRDGNKHQ